MTSELESFIQKTVLKTNQTLADIFKKLVLEYPEETKRQHAIRGMILMYTKQYPEEMEQHKKDMQKLKETLKNQHGADYDNAIRVEFRIPSSLMTRINQTLKGVMKDTPMFLSDEAEKEFGDRTWFRKNFPRFSAPSTY